MPPRNTEHGFFRVGDRNELWSTRFREWIAETDPRFTQWQAQPWAEVREFATTDALTAYLEEEGGPAPAVSLTRQRIKSFLDDTDRRDLLERLKTATPAEIKNYITNNVTDLASARALLIKVVLLLALAVRQ